MSSQKYRVTRDVVLVEEFKGAAAKFIRSLKSLEDRAKKCESLKYQDKGTSSLVSRGGDGKGFVDWENYLQDGKRKLLRVLPKLKDIQKQGKHRKSSFIGSVKGVLPSWAKKKTPGKHIQLHQVIKDSEECGVLMTDNLVEVNSVNELKSIANRIFQEGDNDQIAKDLHDVTSRWNSLNETVINNSNSLETLGYQVDREYRKLSQWHDKCDAVNAWLDISEQHLKEDSPSTTVAGLKEKITRTQERIKEVKRRKHQLEDVNRTAEELLNSGRLDVSDAERLNRFNETLCSRYQGYNDQLTGLQNKLYDNMHQLQNEPGQKKEVDIVEQSVAPNLKAPVQIISPFRENSDNDGNNNAVLDSMKSVEVMLRQVDTSTGKERQRIQEESVKAFEISLKSCERALNDLDEEALQDFSAVGSTITEVRQQLDDIQALERKMVDEDKRFALVKATFNESEKKSFMREDDFRRLGQKVDELDTVWEELWRAHEVNKDRLVHAILIMGGEWMGKVNTALDELENDINSIEIPENDLQALREEELKQKNIMNKIGSYEDAVHSAVDVAREVHRRDLVDVETAKTIETETQALEDRLERLKGEAQDKRQRMFSAVSSIEQATFVSETMVSSSVSYVHSAPDSPKSDEGFVEPEPKANQTRPSYEFLINEKKNQFHADNKSMTEWLNETDYLVNLLRETVDPKKAAKVQKKINAQYEQVEEKQAVVDRIKRISKELANETLIPEESEPFLKDADKVSDRWTKSKKMLDNLGEKDVGSASKAENTSCCFGFMKKRLFPAWAYN